MRVTVRGVGRAAVALFALGAVVQWWAGVAPVLALVASYVAVLLALLRTLPTRVAPAAALIGLLGSYLALLVLLPLVLSGPLRPGVALGVLLAPCLAVCADLGRRNSDAERQPMPWLLLAAACAGGVMVVATVLLAGGEGRYSAIAWTASGDARNHLMDARSILATGGLQGRWLTVLPMLQEGLFGLLLDTHGRGTLAPADLFRHDMIGYATTSAALTILWTLATTALLLGFDRLRGRAGAVVVLVASMIPLTGLALGVLLRDGFVPILLLQPLLLCTLAVLAWLAVGEDTGTPVTVGIGVTAAALPLAATTWTPFFAVLAGAGALPWLRAVLSGRQRWVRVTLLGAGVLAGSTVCLKVMANTDGFLTLTGSIAAPSPAAAAVPPFLVLVVVVAGWSRLPRRAFVPFLAGSVVALGIVVYSVAVQPPGLAWNYYPAKVAWIWALVALPLLLVPFARPGPAGPSARAAPGALGVLLVGIALSPVASPVLPAAVGWTQSGLQPQGSSVGAWVQPDAASLRLVERLASTRKRYVAYAVVPEEDRITNFWLATYEAYDNNSFIAWAYFEQGGPQDICTLLAEQPDRIVATKDPTAQAQLEATCGHDVRVRLVPAG